MATKYPMYVDGTVKFQPLPFKLPQHPFAAGYQRFIDRHSEVFTGSDPLTLEMLSIMHWLVPSRRFGAEVCYPAMGLRQCGVTPAQYMCQTGSKGAANNWAQINLETPRGKATGPGYLARVPNGDGYYFALTEKGLAVLRANAGIAAPKARPAKATGKPAGKRKPKPVPVPAETETPASDAPTGNGNVPEPVTDTALAALASHFNA
jgi:hypothetical protein